MAPRPHNKAMKSINEPNRTHPMGPRGATTRSSIIMIGPERKKSIVPVHPSSRVGSRGYANVNGYSGHGYNSFARRIPRGHVQNAAGPHTQKFRATSHHANVVRGGGEWIHPMSPHLSSVVRGVYHAPPPPRIMVCRPVPPPWFHAVPVSLPPVRWGPPAVRPFPSGDRWIHAATGFPSPPVQRCYPANPALPPVFGRVPVPLWHVTKRLPPTPVSMAVPGLSQAPWLNPTQRWHINAPTVQPIPVPSTHPTPAFTSEPVRSTCQTSNLPQQPTLPIYSIPPPSYITYYINNPPPPAYSASPMNPITATPYRSTPTISPPPAYSTEFKDSDVPPYSCSTSEPRAAATLSPSHSVPDAPPPSPVSSIMDDEPQSSLSLINPDVDEMHLSITVHCYNRPNSPSSMNLDSEQHSLSSLYLDAETHSLSSLESMDVEPQSPSSLNPDAPPYPPHSYTPELILPPSGPWLPEPGSPPAFDPIVADVAPFSEDPTFSTVWRPLPSSSFTMISKRDRFFDWTVECGIEDTPMDR